MTKYISKSFSDSSEISFESSVEAEEVEIDVRGGISRLSRNKAVGVDFVPADWLKLHSEDEEFVDFMSSCFRRVVEE